MKKNDWTLVKKLKRYFRPYAGLSILLLLVIFLSVGISLIQPILWSKLITSIFGKDLKNLYKIVALFVILFVVSAGINLLQSILKAYLNVHIIYDMQQDLFSKMLSMKMDYFDETSNGTIISKITGDTKQIVDLIIKEVIPDVVVVLKLIFSFILMVSISWKLTLITVIFLPALMVYYSKNSKKIQDKQSDVRMANDKVISLIQQAINGIGNIKVLGLKEVEIELFRKGN